MLKKDTLVIAASVVLAVVLVGLIVFEAKNPQGGVILLQELLGRA